MPEDIDPLKISLLWIIIMPLKLGGIYHFNFFTGAKKFPRYVRTCDIYIGAKINYRFFRGFHGFY